MKRYLSFLVLAALVVVFHLSSPAAGSVLLGWNNLGMHCMDSSYSEFSILPPYNTIEAQLIVGGKLVTNGAGYTLTYEAVADPDGSINTSSVGKGNWFDFAALIYGKAITTADEGLNAWNMPGPLNTPQSMLFENSNLPAPGASALVNWFRAEGIPLTPYDDAGNKNPYPLMRLIARDLTNTVVAQSDIVLPVSDEMDCRVCHGANTLAAATPANGWISDPNPGREYRLNILALHDDRQFGSYSSLYSEALKTKGLDPTGLYPTVAAGKPILCASCHSSEALGTASFTSANGKGTVPPLTASMHSKHAGVIDPTLNIPLNDAGNRDACYRCHPGSATRCLRGAMGSAVAADGTMEMQCQSCHGSMSQVGASTRVGWFMEPKCQNCHTGTATSNNGQIRYTSVFDTNGLERVAVDQTFATSADTPAPGISLYRFSTGHGGLQCSACHGSTHAEFPAAHRNDNIRNIQLQGHAGMMVECSSCHTTAPTSPNGGPHGMHPIGQSWVSSHHDLINQAGGRAACQACHGLDYRGTELSRVQGNRTLNAGGTQSFFRGATIGCYTCHQGPSSSNMNSAAAPAIANVSAQTMAGVPVSMILPGNVAGVSMRVISQPANGSVGITNGIATYFPYAGFTGTDTFTFAGYDGAKNSTLATGTILVTAYDATVVPPAITSSPVSQTVIQGSPVALTVTATGSDPLSYQWYKDGWPLAGSTAPGLVLNAAVAGDSGSYLVLVRNSAGSAISAPAALTVLVPPSIVTDPLSQTVLAGTTVNLSVTAAGTAPLSYQWYKDGVAIAKNGTSSTLRLSNVALTASGNYQVHVTNSAGAVDSAIATLLVQSPPVISTQPKTTTVTVGVAVMLSVVASGTDPMTYQWYKDTVALAGATGTSLSIPAAAVTDAGNYYVIITNPLGSATSTTAVVSVTPTITGFSPTTAAEGMTVVISGVDFTGVSAVAFNGIPALFTVDTDAQITTSVPVGATTGKISVTGLGGTVTSVATFTVVPVPTITGIAPAAGPVGTKVIITGTGFVVGTIPVTFNGLAATSVVRNSATQVTATVPAGATTGVVALSTAGGTALSASPYTVTFPPVISSFSPTSSGVGGTVTITGSAFTGTSSVSFNGVIATYAVVSDTQLTVTVPAGATTGKISVTNADGSTTSTGSFTVIPPPTITSFTPAVGPVGTKVTLIGANFTGTLTVYFNGIAATAVTGTATSLTATVPAGASTGIITVSATGGTGASAGSYTVTFPPVISSFTPTSNGVGGTVILTGSAFTGATGVAFNGIAAVFTVGSDTQLTVTVPVGATSGKISVTNPDGTTTSAGSFTVTPPPTITSFTPATGPVGTKVTITGTNLTGATAVTFNGLAAATVSLTSSTSISATVPAGATSGVLSVTTPGGTATSVGSYTVTLPVPTLTSLAPATGVVGTAVTLTGTNFTSATSVAFNGIAASAFTVVSATQITTTVPAGATTGKVSVTTPGGTATSTGSFTVTPPPAITSFTPASGPVGTKVTITGTSLTGATVIAFNGVAAATVTLTSATSISATVPAGATTGPLSVTTPGGTTISAATYTVTLPAPTLTALSPATGVAGTLVTLTGTNFTGATAVAFNGIAATSFTVVSATQITATAPVGATTGKISVTTPGGTVTSTASFTVTPPPTITSFTPATGSVGTKVTITGTNLTGATAIKFNGIAAATITLTSATSISATVPTGATTGTISVTTPGGTATSTATYTVTLPAPTLTALAPASGLVGSTVTLTGTNFTGATTVTFNGVAATAFTVVSATQITATVPTSATTGKIGVTTPGGTATSTASFTVVGPPTITSFTPVSGPVGTKVTITGTNLTGATAISFNGIVATTVTLTSATSVSATVPAGATTGTISITTPGGATNSATVYTVTIPLATVTKLTPATGGVGTSVTLTGTNFTGATAVLFTGATATTPVTAPFTVISATSIVTSVPAGAKTGKISVTTPGGTAASTTSFTVSATAVLPAITSFTPATGPVGTVVTVTGTNLAGVTAASVGGVAATVTVVSATSLTITVPVGAVTGTITVTTAGGGGTSTGTYTVL